jgi:ABC-type transport system substrate-binding protein
MHRNGILRPGQPSAPARRWSLVVATTAIALVLASCSSSAVTSQSPNGSTPTATEPPAVDGGQLVLAVPAETSGWNPTTNEWASYSALVGSTMLEPLAMTDSQGNAQPWLATSFTPNAAFDVWTLKLRPQVTFHDGSAFDATAVKINLEAAAKAPVSSMAVGNTFKQIKVVDPLTVEIDLNAPWASFPNSYLAGQSAVMMAPSALAADDAGSKHPIGTGPFQFDSWQPDTKLKVTKNKHYWRAGLPHLDAIEFRVITDSNTANQALKAGDVDSFETTSADIANNADPSLSIAKDWSTEPSMLITNTVAKIGDQPNPLANAHARRALALATDRKALAADMGDGVQSPTAPFAPESQWGRPEDQNHYPDFDLDQAKQEVAAYEKDTGQSSLSLTISSGADPTTVKTMQQVQAMWTTAGIDVALESIENSSLISKVIVGKYQVAFFSFYTSPDPDQDRYFWSSDTAKGYGTLSINFTQYTTPQIDKDLGVIRTNPDFGARKAAYNDVVDQINAAATNIWMYWTPYSVISSARVHGMQGAGTQHIANFQPKSFLADVWIQP